MSDYYIRSPNDYLEHSMADSVKAAISAALSGRTKSQHKYYKRIPLGKNSKGKNKYEYFYSAEEYQKYLKNQNAKKNNSASSIGDLLSKLFSNSIDGIGDSPDILGLNMGLSKKKKKKKKKKKDDDSDAIDDYAAALDAAMDAALEENHGYKNSGAARDKIKFKEDTNGNDQKGHKYLLRVTLPSGKYRYFYTQKEVDNYRKEQHICADVPKQDKVFNDDEQRSAVNPQFDFFDPDTSENCWSCALAYDMRQKGYDVQSQHFDGGATNDEIERCYAGGKMSNYPGDQDADDYVKHGADENKWFRSEVNKLGGSGTRGILTVTWSDGGGHAINYEVDDKGSVSIVDSQINVKYSGKDVDTYFNDVSSLSVMRTDNLSSTEYMTEHGDKVHYHEYDGKKYKHQVPAGVASYKDGATDYYNDDYTYIKNDNGTVTASYGDGTSKGYRIINKKTGKRVGGIS